MILLGNVFPPALIRRKTTVTPISEEDAKKLLEHGFESFWGHDNTISVASRLAGRDVTPKAPRPAIGLDADNFPTLYGLSYSKVLVLSPNYAGTYRPAIGEIVGDDKITGWQCLLFEFNQ